jgi:phosphate transport system permease protein
VTNDLLPDIRPQALPRKSIAARRRMNLGFAALCVATAGVSLVVLVLLLSAITIQGAGHLSLRFLAAPASKLAPETSGIAPALLGTMWLCVVCAVLTLPVGVATAVLLEEFKPRGIRVSSSDRWLRRSLLRLIDYRRWHGFLQLNITNLAGVPSVVYGIIGLTAFVSMFRLFGEIGPDKAPAFELGVTYYHQYLTLGSEVLLVVAGSPTETAPLPAALKGQTVVNGAGQRVVVKVVAPEDVPQVAAADRNQTLTTDAESGSFPSRSWYYLRVPLGRSVLAGALTLMLVVLPIVIISSQESLRAVPDSLREGALGMGATRWQVVRNITLPAAVPGIMTGSILAMSRAIGEAAPILLISGIVRTRFAPRGLMDDFSVMPVQIFNWAKQPEPVYRELAATGIIVLLVVLLVFNAVAVVIRQKMQKPLT